MTIAGDVVEGQAQRRIVVRRRAGPQDKILSGQMESARKETDSSFQSKL